MKTIFFFSFFLIHTSRMHMNKCIKWENKPSLMCSSSLKTKTSANGWITSEGVSLNGLFVDIVCILLVFPVLSDETDVRRKASIIKWICMKIRWYRSWIKTKKKHFKRTLYTTLAMYENNKKNNHASICSQSFWYFSQQQQRTWPSLAFVSLIDCGVWSRHVKQN